MNKNRRPRTIEVKEKVKIRVGDKEYEFKTNTPTSSFYTDLYDEITAGYDAVILRPLAKIQLLDTAGDVGAEISGDALNVSRDSTELTLSGSAVWNSDRQPATLRVLDTRNVPYFHTQLPGGINVPRGSTINVTWEASFSLDISSATGYLAGSVVNYVPHISLLVDVLINNRGNRSLAIRKVTYRYSDGYEWTLDITGEQGQHRLRLPPTQVTRSGTIDTVRLCTSANVCITFTLTSPLNVNAGDTIGLDVYLA
jgi:hypothetical protein